MTGICLTLTALLMVLNGHFIYSRSFSGGCSILIPGTILSLFFYFLIYSYFSGRTVHFQETVRFLNLSPYLVPITLFFSFAVAVFYLKFFGWPIWMMLLGIGGSYFVGEYSLRTLLLFQGGNYHPRLALGVGVIIVLLNIAFQKGALLLLPNFIKGHSIHGDIAYNSAMLGFTVFSSLICYGVTRLGLILSEKD